MIVEKQKNKNTKICLRDRLISKLTQREIERYRKEAKASRPYYGSITHENVDDIIDKGVQKALENSDKRRIVTEVTSNL